MWNETYASRCRQCPLDKGKNEEYFYSNQKFWIPEYSLNAFQNLLKLHITFSPCFLSFCGLKKSQNERIKFLKISSFWKSSPLLYRFSIALPKHQPLKVVEFVFSLRFQFFASLKIRKIVFNKIVRNDTFYHFNLKLSCHAYKCEWECVWWSDKCLDPLFSII